MGTRATRDELGLDKPGTLARYFAERWLSAKDEQLIAWLLEAALGRNALYFIERTKKYVDKKKANVRALDKLKEQGVGPVISVDCGARAPRGLACAQPGPGLDRH